MSAHTPEDLPTPEPGAVRGFEVVEAHVASRTGRPETCEDFVALGAHWAGVVDGATDKTGRLFDGETGGRVAARAVAAALLGVSHFPGD